LVLMEVSRIKEKDNFKRKRERMSKVKIATIVLFCIVLISISSLTKANVTPEIVPIGAKTVDEFHTLIFGILATDADGDPIDLEVINFPANSIFIDSSIYADSLSGRGSFKFTPDYNQAGIYYVTFVATDTAGAADSQEVEITVDDLAYTHIFVSDTITYQGHIKTEVPVYIDAIQNISAFSLLVTIIPGDRAYFTTDHIEVNIDTVCSSTIRPCPPGDIIRIDTLTSRIMKIENSGSLTANFTTLEAHGDASDTLNPYCVNINILGLAPNNEPLEPGFGLLFKIYFDVLCLSDSLLPDTMVYVNVYGTLSADVPFPNPDTLIRAKVFSPGKLIILGGFKYGDANGTGDITVSDVVYLINNLFKGGPPPNPKIRGDANGNGEVTVSDAVYLINSLFKGGPKPHCYEVGF